MDVTVILTYRCNSRCSMCHVWQNPSIPEEEVRLETMKKIPAGIDNLNLTGGEPTLRSDLEEIVRSLHPKSRKLEISSNGLFPERLEDIIRKYPDVKIRFSLEGFGETNDSIRGETGGFGKKTAGLRRLKELGGCDLGFATVIQDDNAEQISDLFTYAQDHGVELATSALHNAFQFHKSDNYPYDRVKVARQIEGLITAMLKTWSIKSWFRAYLNLGLIEKVLGHDRLIPCTAGNSFLFIDPWSDVYACNVRPDTLMGNLEKQSWDEVYRGEQAKKVREIVANCSQNCWMVGSARTAMRHPRFTRFPKFKPLWWVLINKLRVMMGLKIDFNQYIDYQNVASVSGEKRRFYLDKAKNLRKKQLKEEFHYQKYGKFINR